MIFNSLEFIIFFPIVCTVYFLLGKNRYRNPFLLIASYYFYMNWKPAYAVLILTSTVITYLCGLIIEKNDDSPSKKKLCLTVSLIINIGILFFFKYFNFMNETIFSILSSCGIKWSVPNMDILLPVGISFYTFQAVGYSIDVYRGTVKAERNFITYALFVSFFPQLVAGPIERAKNLIPQFHTEHKLNYSDIAEGFKMMIWGFFMKLCVSDIVGQYVNHVYEDPAHNSGTTFLLAATLFSFQIYCDFAGYSNIARGSARIMGFNLMENFRTPYLAISIKEFWRRWHISLSTWFMDYIYIPLGGNRVKYGRHMLNLMITFVISGLWHGANWTFLTWGAAHGFFLICENMSSKFIYKPKQESITYRILGTMRTFALVTLALVLFRANSIGEATMIFGKIFTEPGKLYVNEPVFMVGFCSLFILILKDVVDNFNLQFNFLHSKNMVVRYMSVILLISYIVLFGALDGSQFIYFQF